MKKQVVNLIKHRLLDEVDRTIAFLGLIFALALTIWLELILRRPLYAIFGVLAFLACVAYLIIRKFMFSSVLSSLALEGSSIRLYLALNVAFFSLFAYSILGFYVRSDPYSRPLGYFIALALMACVEAVDILYLSSRRWCIHLSLFKIVLIGLSLEFSQLLLYPSIIGIDPWTHQMFTLNIINAGHIPEGWGYSALPLMHLLTGLTSLITGLDYKTATMISVSLPQVVCNASATFLLGNFLFNKKVGLLGGLLLTVANWNVTLGFWTIPNTMAAVFMLIVVYLLLKVRAEKPFIGVFLATIFSAALILTHTLTAMCMAILLLAFWAGSEVYNSTHRKLETSLPIEIFVLFLTGMLSWWTFASGQIAILGDLIKHGLSASYFFSSLAHAMPNEVMRYSSTVPFFEQLFNNFGMFLFFTVSLVGCLYMVSRKFGNSYRFVLALGGATILVLSLLAQITGLGIIVERWWYFSQILLAVPLAVAFYLFCGAAKSKVGKAVLLSTLTFSLSFLMIMSPTSNLDNPTFSPNTQVRFALTESELQAVKTTSLIWNKTIGADGYYSEVRNLYYPVKGINQEIAYVNYTGCQDMFVLIRKEIVDHPFLLSYVYKLDYDPRELLSNQMFSRVYDSDSVSGFVFAENYNSTLP